MKKIISIILILNLILLPVSAEVFDYSQYDFSDEAQRQFDNSQSENANSSKTYDKNKYSTPNTSQQAQPPMVIDKNGIHPKNSNNESQNLEVIEDYPYNNSTNPYIQEQNSQKQLSGSVVYIPSGTTFEIQFESGISSGSLEANDGIVATLPTSFTYNGKVIAPAGSMVYGNTVSAKSAGYAYSTGDMTITFTKIQPPEGNPIPISVENIVIKGKSTRAKNMSRDVLVGVGIGIIGGILTCLLTGGGDSRDFSRSMAIGGGIGAVSGGLHGAVQKGDEVQIPTGTKIRLKLTNPVNVSPYNY